MERQTLVDILWFGRDPLIGFPKQLYERDTQGWRSVHPFLLDTIETYPPSVIIEIGVWKGASVLSMAERLKGLCIPGVIIAIDTWLGSSEHWQSREGFANLSLERGYPSIYKKFCNNIISAGLEQYVIPLPLDSKNAAATLASKGISADLIHLDAGHDFESVYSDIEVWWPLLKAGGTFVGDDYDQGGGTFPGVERAFNNFFHGKHIAEFRASDGKCLVRKL